MTLRRHAALGILLAALAAVPVDRVAAAPAGTDPTPEQIKAVAADLVCLCSSCNRESLATCLCTAFAVPEREEIGRLLSEGLTGEQIVQRYVERFGHAVLASPPEGYEIVWVVPIAILAAGVVGVRQVLVHWRRQRVPCGAPAQPVPETPMAGAGQARLKQDLDSYEG